MKSLIRRITRGNYPDKNETWAEYQARSSGAGVIAFAAVLVVTCMVLLAEILEGYAR